MYISKPIVDILTEHSFVQRSILCIKELESIISILYNKYFSKKENGIYLAKEEYI